MLLHVMWYGRFEHVANISLDELYPYSVASEFPSSSALDRDRVNTRLKLGIMGPKDMKW